MSTTRARTMMRQIDDDLRERRDGSTEAIPFFCECAREAEETADARPAQLAGTRS